MATPKIYTAGDQITAADINASLYGTSVTLGENVSAGDALYMKSSDGKAYKADADVAESVTNFLGLAAAAGTSGNATYYISEGGVMTGLSGLTADREYFLSNTAGAISLTEGTYPFKVGLALSTTALLVTFATRRNLQGTPGSTTVSGDTSKHDLFSVSVPGRKIGTKGGVALKIFVTGTFSGGTNPTLRMEYGSTIIATVGPITSGGGGAWQALLDVELLANGATNAQVGAFSLLTPTATISGAAVAYGTAAEDSTTDLNLKVTCQNAASTGSVIAQSGFSLV
jgi:hypothetical protein